MCVQFSVKLSAEGSKIYHLAPETKLPAKASHTKVSITS